MAQGGCDLNIYGKDGTKVGRVDRRGTVWVSGASAGMITSVGVFNSAGDMIGKADRDGTIRGKGGSVIASVGSGGYISTGGRIARDGTIFNQSGARVGNFSGYSAQCRHVAGAYLMFFNSIHRR